MQQTRITTKYQTTIPKTVRKFLQLDKGKEVQWHIVRGRVFLEAVKKIKDPVKFLTSQTKLALDMVNVVREVREER